MKIAICGSQSVGKTTLINRLLEYPEIKNRFQIFDQVVRTIRQKNPNLKINEEGDDNTQRLVIAQHLINSTHNGDAIYDRCIVDGYVYTKYLVDQYKVSFNTLVLGYWALQTIKYDLLFYLPPEFAIVHDGTRSDSSKFQSDICNIFLKTFDANNHILNPIFVNGTVDQRADQILTEIKRHDNKHPAAN